jgi:hypothetical protein
VIVAVDSKPGNRPAIPGRCNMESQLRIVKGGRYGGQQVVNCSGSTLQRSDCRHGDKPDHQSVFHEILALFSHGKGLEPYEQP